jgi:effector-binding domain-containing protein
MDPTLVIHKEVGGFQIASMKTIITKRDELPALFRKLKRICGQAICGPAMTIFHYGSVKEGSLVEVAYQVDQLVEQGEVHTRLLERRKAWTLIHRGAPGTIRQATLELFKHLDQHAGMAGGGSREVNLHIDAANPEKNITEVQVLDHEWHARLANGVEEVLGAEARTQVMQGIELIDVDSSAEDYRTWVHEAMRRIDQLTDDAGEKFRMISCAAHVFPQYRIDHLRGIYEQEGDIDAVLQEMYTDPDWYEDPARIANQLFITKVPWDQEAFKQATTREARRLAYCHCSFVRPHLNDKPGTISSTFCWCGAGWYRRLWEGILGKPIQVEHVDTLLSGAETCKLIITLPIRAEGELHPPRREG